MHMGLSVRIFGVSRKLWGGKSGTSNKFEIKCSYVRAERLMRINPSLIIARHNLQLSAT